MKGKVILAILLAMIITFSISANGISILNNISAKNSEDFVFQPRDITLQDDAFLSASGDLVSHFSEWWYFDAIFDNRYSAQLAVRLTGSFEKILSCITRLDIYKEGILVYHNQQKPDIKDLELSTTEPDIKIDNEQVIKGYIDPQTNELIYDLSFEMQDANANLHLVGITKGYKGEVPGSTWVVVFPRADISGTLEFNDKILNVKGKAYHDHNYKANVEAASNYGWYWGRLYSKNYTVNWACILKNSNTGFPLLVISKTNGEYTNIQPENIEIAADDFTRNNFHKIPMKFSINVETDDILLDVKLTPIDVHFCRVFTFVNYWRYHMDCKGDITVDLQNEKIEDLAISEFIKFRPTYGNKEFNKFKTNFFDKLVRCFFNLSPYLSS